MRTRNTRGNGQWISERPLGRGVVACIASMAAFAMVTGAIGADDPANQLKVRASGATGVAAFVTPTGGRTIAVPLAAGKAAPDPLDFFVQHGHLFGVRDPNAQLRVTGTMTDRASRTHTTFQQMHNGVPVFGALLRVHTDPQGQVTAVNGTFVPDIKLKTNPTLSANEGAAVAVDHMKSQVPANTLLQVLGKELYVYRVNLARGIPGANHLVYEVEVGNGADVREFVYVDAHSGRIVDQITGIHEAINRQVYDNGFGGGFLVWSEGDGTPYGATEVDNLIDFTEDSYNLYTTLSDGSFPSWDGVDGALHAVANTPYMSCPNASWNGLYTQYCTGVTSDDVVAHEWSHAYTGSTHGLIYRWQSGALNESYSDIFGEVVDLLNGAGTDTPDVVRTPGDCSTIYGSPPPELLINLPLSIAGSYNVRGATFNPTPPVSATADVELVNDGDDEAGAGTLTDSCQALIGFTSGNIALIDRGACSFIIKANNASAAGAVGVIVVNNQGDGTITMGGAGSPGIPSVFIGQSDGDTIKAELGGAVNATVTLPASTVNSIRWLVGEDSTSFGGAIRDMWNPTCMSDAGKVSDTAFYHCGPIDSDNGGVHSNSGIPNHGFALLVDGGTYNGQTIAAIGMTKAAHIYWHAETFYQVPVTDFADHADSLEQSCTDLTAVTLTELSTDSPVPASSMEVISSTDCDQVSKMIAAVEFHTEPTFCGFSTLLDPNAPNLCGGMDVPHTIYLQDWESGLGVWTPGTRNVTNPSTFDTPDWAAVGGLPGGRLGSAAFVADDPNLGDCSADLETGVLYLESHVMTVPAWASPPRIAFDHSVSTEFGWDGSNLKISVNGGSFTVVPPAAFVFNGYNDILITPGGGNDNPMAGEDAFTGTDGGSNSGGVWGQSQVDLSGIAGPGDDIQFRLEMGLDGCNGAVGWYVDEFRVHSCGAPCVDDSDCDDDNVCTLDDCDAGTCLLTLNIYGDVNADGTINVFDVFCVLNGFGGAFAGNCTPERLDIEPCDGNGTINVFDLFGVLNGFGGADPCCNGLP